MGTFHRYTFDDSYVIDISPSKVRIDFEKAGPFHQAPDMIELRGDTDIVNIIYNFFNEEGPYSARAGVKEGIMTLLDLKAEDLDFLVLADNEDGLDANYFYKPAFVFSVLESIQKNKEQLLANFHFPFPECMQGIPIAIEFMKKAMETDDLVFFRLDC